MRNKRTKLFSLLMAIVTFIGILPTNFIMASQTPVPVDEVTVRAIQAGESLMQNSKGAIMPRTVDFVVYSKDGKDWPAYCIHPEKPGAQIGVSYKVNGTNLLENPKVYGAVINGYPFKTADSLNVNSNYEAYYATKMAIWSLLGAEGFSFAEMKPYGTENQHVYDAYKKIYEAGLASTGIDNSVQLSIQKETEENEGLTQIYSVQPAISYSVSMDGSQPVGTQLTDMNGTPKTSFAAGEKFKVIIPTDSVAPNSNGSFNINITGIPGSGKALVYEGTPVSNPVGQQSYALIYEADLGGSGIWVTC